MEYGSKRVLNGLALRPRRDGIPLPTFKMDRCSDYQYIAGELKVPFQLVVQERIFDLEGFRETSVSS